MDDQINSSTKIKKLSYKTGNISGKILYVKLTLHFLSSTKFQTRYYD